MAGTKKTGDLAQTSVGPSTPIVITGNTTSGSASVSSLSSTAGLTAGMGITGAGIPTNTTILSINTGASTLVLSANATATASAVSLTVAGETQIVGLMEWSIDFKRKTADATTTDDSAWESSLGSSRSWTAKAKYCYLFGDTSQESYVQSAITAAQSPQKWNFFGSPTIGEDSYSGMAYIDGIVITAGVGKIIGTDVSLKGTGPLNILAQSAPVATGLTLTGEQAED